VTPETGKENRIDIEKCQNPITNTMVQIPFCEAGYEIIRGLWKPKVHYGVNKSPPPVSIITESNEKKHNLTLYFKDQF
jgi:hypothetical protein